MSKRTAAKRYPKQPVRRRIAKRAGKGEPTKVRVTVVIDPDDLAWVEHEAKRQATSVSAVLAGGVAILRRNDAFQRCLAAAGGTDDITEEDLDAVRAEQQ